mgnify:CR=1 FL=1
MTAEQASARKPWPLHWKMAVGFAVGIGAGLLANLGGADAPWLQNVITYLTDPVGQLFLRLLFMLVVPLVFSALVLGVVEIGNPQSLGRIGGRTLLWILVGTSIAVAIGLVLVNLIQPGVGIPQEIARDLLAQGSERSGQIMASAREAPNGIQILLNIVPRNVVDAAAKGDLIAVMFFALMVGAAATMIRNRATTAFVDACQGLFDICLRLIEWVIRLAPYAVAALLFGIVAKLGIDVLLQLAKFVGTVILALGIQMFVVFPLLIRLFGGRSPMAFFKAAEPAIMTAFSTSSSSATLPTTLMVAEERLGVPRRVARFVCTLGATANMNGTAMFEGITILFLAQFFGIELSLAQQALILGLCVLGAIGAAGVPGGSLPVIAMILAMFGIPPEGIGLILGVDRLLDMCRTTVNVTGDLAISTLVARGAGDADVPADAATDTASGSNPHDTR